MRELPDRATAAPARAWLLLVLVAVIGCGGGGGGAPPSIDMPGVPAEIEAFASLTSVKLYWTPAEYAASYNLYWTNVDTFGWRVIQDVDGPYVHDGLTTGATYTYYVTATNAAGESGPTRTVAATTGLLTDPLYADQWHLKSSADIDINVEPVWRSGIFGDGVRIAIVDDGFDRAHDDIAETVFPGASHDYVTGGSEPSGEQLHGTLVVGAAAARGGNGRGVASPAWHAEVVAYNMLKNQTSVTEADAMVRGRDEVDVSNNSWGPPDDTRTELAPQIFKDAIATGLAEGRGGLGIVYVFAAGNGGESGDDANLDGYVNLPGVMAVNSVDRSGRKPWYGEDGANVWISAPTAPGITTTDRSGAPGYSPGSYVGGFDGTSASCPIVSGVVALVLEANPDLAWHEVRRVLAETATKNDETDAGWAENGAGLHVHHSYGFGVINAADAVARAKAWTKRGALGFYVSNDSRPDVAIPDDDAVGVSDSIVVSTPIKDVFSVQVTLDTSDHELRGDLEVVLTSPDGTESVLAAANPDARWERGFDQWTFSTVRCLGEDPNGTWTLTVRDRNETATGTFRLWYLTIQGN